MTGTRAIDLAGSEAADTDRMAAAVATTSWPDAPIAVRHRVVDLVADCVAVAALGSARPELRRLEQTFDAVRTGFAVAVGSARGWPVSTAAVLTGSAVAADQLQDGHGLARGHPASHVVPAVLAVAQEHDLRGYQVLSAVLAGYEAGVRVGQAMRGTPSGVHDIGTWGQVAVSAGVASLLAPGDAVAARHAIELSAAAVLLTDARTVFAGATGSHAILGASIQHGLSCGMAAVARVAAEPGVLDRHVAAVAARAWDPVLVAPNPTPGRGTGWVPYEVLGGYVKVHPTSAHLHGVNDAVQDIVESLGGALAADDVASVEARVYAQTAEFDAVADDELAARFSAPTTIAVALLTGRLDESTLTSEQVASPEVHSVAQVVSVAHDPRLDSGHPEGRPARVTVRLRSGRVESTRCGRLRGDADRALDRDARRAKASRLLTRRFGPAGDDVLAAVHALVSDASARDVGAALRVAAGGAQ